MRDLKYVHNDEIAYIIDSYIHSQRDRAVMKRKLLDDIKFEDLAEEFDLSTTTVKRIYKQNKEVIEYFL